MNTSYQAEATVCKFVRAYFKARVAKVDGSYQSEVRKNVGRVLITNPQRVLFNLKQVLGAPIAERGNTTVFKCAKKGTVALTVNQGNAVLKLVSM